MYITSVQTETLQCLTQQFHLEIAYNSMSIELTSYLFLMIIAVFAVRARSNEENVV